MKILPTAVVLLALAASAMSLACSDSKSAEGQLDDALDDFASQFPTDTPFPEPRDYAFNSEITVDAGKLDLAYFDDAPTGSVTLTMFEVRHSTQPIDDEFITGQQSVPRGAFVIVFYSVRSDLNREMQLYGQVNVQFVLEDDRGRQWKDLETQDGYSNPGSSVAVANGYEQPAADLAPGFEKKSAIVYDVPPDATGLVLVSPRLGVRIALPESASR